jgi:hypothetical protein
VMFYNTDVVLSAAQKMSCYIKYSSFLIVLTIILNAPGRLKKVFERPLKLEIPRKGKIRLRNHCGKFPYRCQKHFF